MALRKNNKFAEAKAAYTKCLELDPEFGDCLLDMGLILQQHEGRLDEARTLYLKILAIQKHFYPTENKELFRSMSPLTLSQALSNLGVLYATQGDMHNAEQVFRQAYALSPQRGGNAYRNLVYFLESNGRAKEAAMLK